MKIQPILFAFFLGAVSCSKHEAKLAEEPTQFEATSVVGDKLSNELALPGELEGYFETEVNAKISGYIKKIHVDIGDNVIKSQLLVELEAPELVSQLEAARADVQRMEAVFLNSKAKYNRLFQAGQTPGAVSAFDLDMARTNKLSDSLGFAAARSKLQSVESLTDYLRIVAPFDGVVTERALAPGAFVGPGEKGTSPILKLKNQTKLRLHIPVPEKYLAEVSVGNMVQFKVKAFPGKNFEGHITRMARNVAAATRSELIEVEINNQNGQLLPGMYAHAIIPIRRPDPSLVVPSTSVVTNMERSFVIQVTNNGQAHWVDVERGQTKGPLVEVFGNLKPGDTILRKASDEVRDSTPIQVVMTAKNL